MKNRYRSVAVFALLLLLVVPAGLAQDASWPTVMFTPVYLSGQSAGEWRDGRVAGGATEAVDSNGERHLVDPAYDNQAAMAPAPSALPASTRRAAQLAQRLRQARYPGPAMSYVDTGSGKYFLVFFTALKGSTTFLYPFGCSNSWVGQQLGWDGEAVDGWRFMHGSSTLFPPRGLESPYQAGGTVRRQRRMVAYFSSQLIHETVHGIQYHTGTGCQNGRPLWLTEGIADALAYLLSAEQDPGVFELFEFAMGRRDFSVSLDTRQAREDQKRPLSYGAAAFFRYLAEANAGGGVDALDILKPLALSRATSDAGAYRDIEAALAGVGRSLYLAFPAFLTEYASYGGSRYKRSTRTRDLRTEYRIRPSTWQEEVFDGCVELNLGPRRGADVEEITLNPIAGECVRVTWADIQQPVGLQLFAATDGDLGALHLGEAHRVDDSGEHFCWETTKGLSRRLRRPLDELCLLKRDTYQSSDTIARWSSDFVAQGSGSATFVLTNVAREAADTKPISLRFHAKIMQVTAQGAALSPQQPANKGALIKGAPVREGLSDMRARVHAMAYGDDRMLFDGRSIAPQGEEVGFAPASALGAGGGGGDAQGAGVIVRTQEYMVQLGKRDDTRQVSVIIKDPPQGMAMVGAIASAGQEGIAIDQDCGYLPDVQMETLSEDAAHDTRTVRLTADLFDIQRARQEGCAGLKQAWVERAVVELTLPQPALIDPNVPVVRLSPPGQELYDGGEFSNGPALGGIATAESIRLQGRADLDELMDSEPSDPAGGGRGDGDGGGMSPQCEVLIQQGAFRSASRAEAQAMISILQGMGCLCAVSEAAAAPGATGFSPAAKRALAGACR